MSFLVSDTVHKVIGKDRNTMLLSMCLKALFYMYGPGQFYSDPSHTHTHTQKMSTRILVPSSSSRLQMNNLVYVIKRAVCCRSLRYPL